MVRSIAWCVAVTLALGSGRLLACDWECGDAVTTPVEVACHHESRDSGVTLIGGIAHECPPDAIEPVLSAAKNGDRHVGGASQALSRSICHAQPSIGRLVFRPLEFRAAVPHPLLISVLRI
ncbi:MAG: hypothetical protein Q7R30_08765 [Acidobacteriota bacterium]|nr:hypothetical protein [Acidobacteriota bacterium]